MSLTDNLEQVRKEIPDHVTLVAVSKTKPNEMIEEAYACGQRHFGENKVQELVGKYEALPKDIQWHMIGHLQSNKVKYIAPFVYLIHGVDSLKLLKEINKQGSKNERVIDVLLQMHIAEESTKFGLNTEELKSILDQLLDFEFVSVKGVMGMATFTNNEEQIAKEFESLVNTFNESKTNENLTANFDTLSFGMSGDYRLAIQKGSTMVRVGSAIFGSRQYP